MTYPHPIDTSSIQLSDDVQDLIERLSENVHNVWASGRLADGWKYGASRDDAAKTHPCLIPYDDLPESEKDYDRSTVTQTLKTIIALGAEVHVGRH